MKSKILVAFIGVLLYSCVDGESKDYDNGLKVEQVDQYQKVFYERSEKINKVLKNKSSKLIDSLLKVNNSKLKNNAILYYSSFDCSSCVDIGLNFLKDLGVLDRWLTQSILSGQFYSNGPLSKVKFNLHDEKSSIKNDLSAIITPALIFYDEEEGVNEVYIIPTFKDSLGLIDLRKRVLRGG